MDQKNNNLSIRFQPALGSDVLSIESEDLPGNSFRCSEVYAKIGESGFNGLELKGFLDDRIPYSGKIRKNSKSEKSLINYLAKELSENAQKSDSKVDYVNKCLLESSRITGESNSILNNLIEIYASDFTCFRDRSLRKFKSNSGTLMSKENISSAPKIAIFKTESRKSSIPYETVSGFLSVEISEDSKKSDQAASTYPELSSRIRFLSKTAKFIKIDDKPFLEIDIQSDDDISDVSFYFHIGKIEKFSPPWSDHEASLLVKEDRKFVRLELNKFTPSRYEYTCYAHSRNTQDVLWMSSYGDNKQFVIKRDFKKSISKRNSNDKKPNIPLKTFESFSRWCTRKRKENKSGDLLKKLFNEKNSRNKLSEYYEESLRRLSRRNSIGAFSVVEMVRTLGLSSVVMVTPEGPHAIAGGLSQVIVGLSEALSSEGLDLKIVTPLYEEPCGNHHTSFHSAITDGLYLFGEKCFPEFSGEIFLNIPGTSWQYSNTPATPRRVIRVEIYEVNVRNIRMLFLRHKNLGDRLYGGISAKDQILRSIFLSRGALELCRQDSFDIDPGIIITHDWLPSLITPLLELDPEYLVDSNLKKFTAIHMLHNVGRAYQGKFHLVEHGENLWDLLGLDNQHMFGFLDEEQDNYLNFTKAACFHNKNALITVSKPYADQLLQDSSGEGLTKTLNMKRDILFGISNGIPQKAVRQAAFKRVSDKDTFATEELLPVDKIIELKKNLKKKIQLENKLIANENSILAVFVGRLTEQKGLGLLSAQLDNGKSLIENALSKYPNFQIIVAGPPSRFDQAFIDFENFYNNLKNKYPGRCVSLFEFVPHSYAIELTAAADMFLMPSRYEPGGITQLEALAVGTTVVAHRVGGISATLSSFKDTSGNSFLFESFSQEKFWESLQSACTVISDETTSKILVERALSARNGWENRVPYYLSLFQKACGIFDIFTAGETTFTSSRLELLRRISAEKFEVSC